MRPTVSKALLFSLIATGTVHAKDPEPDDEARTARRTNLEVSYETDDGERRVPAKLVERDGRPWLQVPDGYSSRLFPVDDTTLTRLNRALRLAQSPGYTEMTTREGGIANAFIHTVRVAVRGGRMHVELGARYPTTPAADFPMNGDYLPLSEYHAPFGQPKPGDRVLVPTRQGLPPIPAVVAAVTPDGTVTVHPPHDTESRLEVAAASLRRPASTDEYDRLVASRRPRETSRALASLADEDAPTSFIGTCMATFRRWFGR